MVAIQVICFPERAAEQLKEEISVKYVFLQVQTREHDINLNDIDHDFNLNDMDHHDHDFNLNGIDYYYHDFNLNDLMTQFSGQGGSEKWPLPLWRGGQALLIDDAFKRQKPIILIILVIPTYISNKEKEAAGWPGGEG